MVFRFKTLAFLFLFFLTHSSAFSAETSRGLAEPSSKNTTGISKNSSLDLKADSCPPALVDWVEDDFANKSSLKVFSYSLIDFPSEAKSCLASVKSYENQIQKSGKQTNLHDTENLSSYLADRYKQVSPHSKDLLNKCNNLPDGKDKVVKSRFYMATTKLEAHSSTILDEISYIDSIVPTGQVTKNLECNTIYPFPQLGRKCEEYKKALSGPCKESQADRLNSLVQKTKIALDQIEELQNAYKRCPVKTSPEACQNIAHAIQLIRSEVPWIDGKIFQAQESLVRTNPFWKTELKDEKIKEGIVNQLTENRKVYLKQYSANLQHVKCLTFSTSDGKATCSFQDTRKYISELPDLVEPALPNTAENREFNTQIDAEKCLISRGIDREETKNITDNLVVDAGLTILTGGLSAASGSLRLVKSASGFSKLRNASLINGAMVTVNASSGVAQAYKSCSKSTDQFLKFNGKKEILKENICPESTSDFEKIKEEQSSCLIDSLLTATDVWPFVRGLKLASKLSKFTNEDLLSLYRDPKQRKNVESILAKNGNLSDGERIDAAESLVGRKLSQKEKDCIIDAHNLASDKVFNTEQSVAAGKAVLDKSDLRQKSEKMLGCGLASTEVSLLMRAGVTGRSESLVSADSKAVLANYEKAKALARQSGSDYGSHGLLADTAKTLGKFDEAESAYKKAYDIFLENKGLAKANPTQTANIINNLSFREINEFSDFAAGSGKTELIPLIEKRRTTLI